MSVYALKSYGQYGGRSSCCQQHHWRFVTLFCRLSQLATLQQDSVTTFSATYLIVHHVYIDIRCSSFLLHGLPAYSIAMPSRHHLNHAIHVSQAVNCKAQPTLHLPDHDSKELKLRLHRMTRGSRMSTFP